MSSQNRRVCFHHEKLVKAETYFVYCRTGVRSLQTLRLMRELNFLQVSRLSVGVFGWKLGNLSVKP